jgi:hypothetical protein
LKADIKRCTVELLCALGSSSEEVAESLRKLNIKGDIGSYYYNPLSFYLTSKGVDRIVRSGERYCNVAVVHSDNDIAIKFDDSKSYHHYRLDIYPRLIPVRRFLSDFHHRIYINLIGGR